MLDAYFYYTIRALENVTKSLISKGYLCVFVGNPKVDGIEVETWRIISEYFGKYGSSEWYGNYQAVSGACMAVRKDVFRAIGPFDDQAGDDSDNLGFCSKLQKQGYRIVYSPYARLRFIEIFI